MASKKFRTGRVKFGMPNHRWNAVRINGRWHPFDLTSNRWLTRPSDMILDRFPDNSYWQLFPRPYLPDIPIGKRLDYAGFRKYGVTDLKPDTRVVYVKRFLNAPYVCGARPGCEEYSPRGWGNPKNVTMSGYYNRAAPIRSCLTAANSALRTGGSLRRLPGAIRFLQ